MRKLLEEEGFDGRRISAAAQSGSRRSRRADAGDVGRRVGEDGRQVGKSLSDEEKSRVLEGLKEKPLAEKKKKKKSEKKFAIALGMVEPETRLTPTSNPDPDGILAFSPQRSPLKGNPIVMKIGTQSGVQFRGDEMFGIDTGFGATHILNRIIDDPKRTPIGGEELLEQIVLDAQKIATDFNTIYVGNGGNLILHNSNTQDSLIVKPQRGEISIVSMFKQSE